jgi:hypothetical protein
VSKLTPLIARAASRHYPPIIRSSQEPEEDMPKIDVKELQKRFKAAVKEEVATQLKEAKGPPKKKKGEGSPSLWDSFGEALGSIFGDDEDEDEEEDDEEEEEEGKT